MATPVEIWGYGLTADGGHSIEIEARDLEEGQSVFVGDGLNIHHISIDDAGILSIALDRPIATVTIHEDKSGVWLAPKKWDEIAQAFRQQVRKQSPPQPGWFHGPMLTHAHDRDTCVQCSRCSGCTIAHAAGCDMPTTGAVLTATPAAPQSAVLDNVLREVSNVAARGANVDAILSHPDVMQKIAELARAQMPHAISQVRDGGITLFGIPVKIDPTMQPGEVTVKYDKGEHIWKGVAEA